MSRSIYGINDDGDTIEAPKGWVLIPEGEYIPQQHREYIGTWWCGPRRCHSTMTPFNAMIWGSVRAYAKPL